MAVGREGINLKRLLFLLVAVLLLTSCGNNSEQPKAKKPQTLDDSLKTFITNTVGSEAKKSDGKKRVVKINTIDDVVAGVGFKIVNIELNADQHATLARTRDEMLLQSAKLFPGLFENKEVSEVSLNWRLPLTDDKGNKTQQTVMTITLRKENAKTINWKNFDVYKFKTIADRYYEHKALQVK